jgi:hypothetical protein
MKNRWTSYTWNIDSLLLSPDAVYEIRAPHVFYHQPKLVFAGFQTFFASGSVWRPKKPGSKRSKSSPLRPRHLFDRWSTLPING